MSPKKVRNIVIPSTSTLWHFHLFPIIIILKKKSLLLCCQVDAKLSLERKQFDAYLHQSGFLKQISDL